MQNPTGNPGSVCLPPGTGEINSLLSRSRTSTQGYIYTGVAYQDSECSGVAEIQFGLKSTPRPEHGCLAMINNQFDKA